MDFSRRDFTTQEKIELLQRWILVHSYLYYELDLSVVSDHMYDRNSQQLHMFKINYPTDWKNARYTYAMVDFDGSTGFGYVNQLNTVDTMSIVFDAKQLKIMNQFR
jgi:NAD-dependent DNA ligase